MAQRITQRLSSPQRRAAWTHAALWAIVACAWLPQTGCQYAAHSRTERAIMAVASRMNHALMASAKWAATQPIKLKVRYNPCACDPNLLYEIQIYEQWQYVVISGNFEHQEQREPFESSFILNDDLYTSPKGQKYYTLIAQ